ncbi:Long-chain-fatty-acid--CoA ligase @ Long-chain fatty-acid-CoA ligase, Mycobacterial subgroup FadD15 [Streptomyces misionensis JCM 4497]
MDAPRLRRLGRRARHRPRLPHLLRLPDPLDPARLRRRRPRHRDRPAGRRPRPRTPAPARPQAPVGHGEGACGPAVRRRGPDPGGGDRRTAGHARARHPGHPRLHLRHHRPPQGLRAHPRQLPRRGRQRHRTALPRLQAEGRRPLRPALPAPVARLRAHGGHRLPPCPRPPRARAQPQGGRPAAGPRRLPAHLPAGHPLHAGEDLQLGPRQGRVRWPRRRLRPGRRRRPPLRRGAPGPAERHRRRTRPRAQDPARFLRPARLPPHPGRHGRPGPARHLRRLPARPPPRRVLRGRRDRDLRGVRPHRDHRRHHRHPAAQAAPGHGGLAAARHPCADRRRRGDPRLRRPRAARLLGPAGRRGRPRDPRRLAAHRGPRPAGRRGLSDHHRPQEGTPHHIGRQVGGARAAGELAAPAPADLPGDAGRRRPPVRRRAAHPRSRGHHPLAPDERQTPGTGGTPRRRPGVAGGPATGRGRRQPARLPPRVHPPLHRAARRLHGGGRPADPLHEAPARADPAGLRARGGGPVRRGLNRNLRQRSFYRAHLAGPLLCIAGSRLPGASPLTAH